MIFNMVGGGQSDGPVEAGTIVVNYPAGATCTVTNGSDTYTALDTSGAAAFIVEPGTWTVTATPAGGGTPASQSVTVTAGGWVEVELTFNIKFNATEWQKIILYPGDPYGQGLYTFDGDAFTGTVSPTMSSAGQFCNAAIASNSKYDLTNISSIKVDITTSQALSSNGEVVVAVSPTQQFYNSSDQMVAVAYLRIKTKETNTPYSLDVSGLSGQYFIIIGIAIWNSPGEVSFTASDLRLEGAT